MSKSKTLKERILNQPRVRKVRRKREAELKSRRRFAKNT